MHLMSRAAEDSPDKSRGRPTAGRPYTGVEKDEPEKSNRYSDDWDECESNRRRRGDTKLT